MSLHGSYSLEVALKGREESELENSEIQMDRRLVSKAM